MRRIGVGARKATIVDRLKAENAALKMQIEQLTQKDNKSKEPKQ